MRQEEQERQESLSEEAVLWRRHARGGDRQATEALVERYLDIAKRIAGALYAQRPDDSVEFGDYLQYARVGLLEAIDRFDPSREASFATFATYRIRGAILSGLEHATELASQKAQRRRLRRERLKLLKQSGRSDGTEAFIRMVDMALYLAIGQLLEESATPADAAERAADPYGSLELKQLRRRLVALVDALPPRERSIVRHHYFEHRDFSEISVLLGLSKGRLSQLHSRALRLLREAYQEMAGFEASF